MKKKILTIALVVALIAIMVSGTFAYFTAEDQVSNTFTIGSVKIEIYENDAATEKDTIEFGTLTPIVNVDAPSQDPNYIKKVVEVKNTGANDAYIRTHIAIPTALVNYLYLDLDTTGWTRRLPDTTATVDGVAYTVFTYDYNTAVTSEAFTGELLKGVYLNSNVDLEEDADGNLVFVLRDADREAIHTSTFVAHTKTNNGYTSNTACVLVASEAIQAEGFSEATAALNSGFGADTNPWQ